MARFYPKVRIKLEGKRQVKMNLTALERRAPAAMARAIYREAKEVMEEAKKRVPVDQEDLRRSAFLRYPKVTPHTATVEMGFAAPWAMAQHEGFGPAAGSPGFRPPAQALMGWAERKLGDPRAAYGVAIALERKGMKGKKFLEGPLREARTGMNARIAQSVRQELIDKHPRSPMTGRYVTRPIL